MFIRTSNIKVSKDYVNLENIKNQLKVSTQEWDGSRKTIYLYMEEDNNIIIPRFFPLDEKIIDKSDEGENIDIESSIIPRNDRQKNSINFLSTNTNGILKLEPGSGKTVVAIASICNIKKKTIILVNKNSLKEQWINELIKHTNLTIDDIGVLSTTPKKYKEAFSKSVIITTVQTLISGIKKEEFLQFLQNSGIGVSIFDEAHTTVGPTEFSKASYSLKCKRVFGLTATPIRYDMNEILNYHLGDVTYFEPGEDELLRPQVMILHFPFGIWSQYKTPYYLAFQGRFQYSRYEKAMVKSKSYTNRVVKMIRELYYTKKRKIVVLGKNIKAILHLIKHCEIEKENVGICLPSASDEEILKYSDIANFEQAFRTKSIIFATYKGLREGNSRDDLDCLIMLTPTGNVEQAGGRILRVKDGKIKPLIIDLVDTEIPAIGRGKQPLFIASRDKRKEIYDTLKWEYKEIYLK